MTYRFFFIQPDRELGAVVDLKPGPNLKQPVEVMLQPTAKVRGGAGGYRNRIAGWGAQVNPMIVMGNPKKGEMTSCTELMRDTELYANMMGQKAIMPYMTKIMEPKPKGEFVIDTLLPEPARFYIAAGAGRREAYCPCRPSSPARIAT